VELRSRCLPVVAKSSITAEHEQDGVHLVLPFKASSAHTRRWLTCQCWPGQTSFCCPQSWCLCGRWDVNEIPHVSCCCIVFHCNASDLFYTKIATVRCVGDASLASLPVLFTLGWTTVTQYSRVVSLRHPTTAISSEFVCSTSYWCSEIWSRDVFCYAIATGCRLPNELSINYAHLFIGDYMVMHHGTLQITSSIGQGQRSGLRSTDTVTLEVLRTLLSFGDRAFSVTDPRAWYSLPINVRSAQSMYSFTNF